MADQQILPIAGLDAPTVRDIAITTTYTPASDATLFHGDCLDLIASLPDAAAQLVVTSPPYNIGKKYERKKQTLEDYLAGQKATVDACMRVLAPGGSICWQVGNHVDGAVK